MNVNLPRWWWLALVIAVTLVLAVAKIAPANLGVLTYKLALLSVAVVLSTLLDRAFFKTQYKHLANANVARALVFLAVVLGLSLGI